MTELVIVAAALYGFAMVSERLAMSPVTAPMVFTLVGVIVGPAGLGWFDLTLEGEAVAVLVEATLVLVLFTDATRIDLRVLRRHASTPGRLLAIGLPLTIVAGTAVALGLFDDLTVLEAALIAAVLAPTDAALGQAVVSDRRLPVSIRQSLNVESGLNDGIVVPIVTVVLALAVAESEASGIGVWGRFLAEQIGLGLVVGSAVGLGGGWLLHQQASRNRVEGVYRQLATIAVAVASFAVANLVGGNGFVASFTAGLAFGHIAREQCRGIQDFTEDEGELLAAVTFVVFGAVVAGPRLDQLTGQIALYAVGSLTVVRVLPVLIALLGSRFRIETRLFLGWFGPRGLASILLAIVVFDELGTPGASQVLVVATWTVLASVFAHGLTASPWAGRLAARLSGAPDDSAEMAPMPELPTRRRM